MAEEANLLVQSQNNKLERSKSDGNSSERTRFSIGNNSVIDRRRASLGSSYHGDSSEGSPAVKQKVIPHYLRPFTDSCHDLCKYGRRLTEEPSHWRDLPKRIGKQPVEIVVSKKPPMSVDKKKVVVMKTMNRNINRSPDHVTVSEAPVENTSSLDDLFMEQPKVISTKSSVSDASEGKRGKSPRNDGVKDIKFAVTSKSAASVDASQGKIARTKSHSIVKDSKTSLASKPPRKNVLPRLKGLSVSLSSTADMNAEKRRNLKVVPSTKDRSSSQKSQKSKPKNDEIFKALTGSLSYHGNNHLEDEKKVVVAAIEEEKMENESDEENIGETPKGDTSYIDDKPIIPLPTDNRGTKQNGNEIALVAKETAKKNLKDTANANPARSPRKGIAANIKIKDSSLTKTKCQKGRTVELQSANNDPRSLKFKNAKVLPVNQEGKADVTKKFNKAFITKDRVDPKSSEVVLRHSTMEDKKDAQGLFNNVIEETTSKLVESRKSKVKALVGAFETIISLQDTKPSSNVVTKGYRLPIPQTAS